MRGVLLFSLGLVACSGSAGVAPETGTVNISDVAVDTTGPEVLVRVRVQNGTKAPVFAMTSPRRSIYQPERSSLELSLVEQADWQAD